MNLQPKYAITRLPDSGIKLESFRNLRKFLQQPPVIARGGVVPGLAEALCRQREQLHVAHIVIGFRPGAPLIILVHEKRRGIQINRRRTAFRNIPVSVKAVKPGDVAVDLRRVQPQGIPIDLNGKAAHMPQGGADLVQAVHGVDGIGFGPEHLRGGGLPHDPPLFGQQKGQQLRSLFIGELQRFAAAIQRKAPKAYGIEVRLQWGGENVGLNSFSGVTNRIRSSMWQQRMSPACRDRCPTMCFGSRSKPFSSKAILNIRCSSRFKYLSADAPSDPRRRLAGTEQEETLETA